MKWKPGFPITVKAGAEDCGLHLRQERWGLQLRIRKSFPCAAMACLISGGSLLPRGRGEREPGLQAPPGPQSGVSDEWSEPEGCTYGASSWQQTSGVGKAWVSILITEGKWYLVAFGELYQRLSTT